MPGKKPKKPISRRGSTLRNIFQDGPHLTCFLVCEKLLDEKDGVKSAIRIVNQFVRTAIGQEVPKTMPRFAADVVLFMSLKKGVGGKDRHQYEIQFQNAGGEVVRGATGTLVFEGGPSRSVDVRAHLRLDFDREGVHWIELYVDEVLMTRLPINVVYQTQQSGGSAPPETHVQ